MLNHSNIRWDVSEDSSLQFNVKKYGTTKWYKIFFNLYTKHAGQIKLRWRRWNHFNIQKGYWRQLEDVLIVNSWQRSTAIRSFQKFYVPNRTLWQCFFRNKLFLALNELKFQIPLGKSKILLQNVSSNSFRPNKQFCRHIEIQYINNGYFSRIKPRFEKFDLMELNSIQKRTKLFLYTAAKLPNLYIKFFKKLLYRRLMEQYLLLKNNGYFHDIFLLF